MHALTPESAELIVTLVATNDAAWVPLRAADWAFSAAIAARLLGDPKAVGGGGVADRKAAQRRRDSLTTAGFLAGGKPTPDGKRFARTNFHPFTAKEIFRVVHNIAAAERREDYLELTPGKLVPEQLAAGARWEGLGQSLAYAGWALRPLLADGLLASRSDIDGRVYYELRDERLRGRRGHVLEAIAECCGPLNTTWNETLFEIGRRAWRETRLAIQSDRNVYSEIGQAPLPVGKGLVSGRDPDDLAGLKPVFRVTRRKPSTKKETS